MLTVLFGAMVFAQTLSFGEALERAVDTPLVLAGEHARKQRGDEASGMGRLTENPLIQVQPGVRVMEPGGTGGEIYVTVNQRIRLTGQGEKRKESVHSEVNHDGARAAAALREARLRIAETWLRCWAAREVLAVAESEVSLATDLAQRVEQTFKAGESTRVDVALLNTFRGEAALAALSAEGQMFDWGVELARVTASPTEEPLATTAEPPHIDVSGERELRAHLPALDRHPQVRAAHAARQMEAARLAELRAARGTELGVGAMGWREGGGDYAVVGTLELVLPVFERGKRESSVAAAAVAQAEQHERSATIDAQAERLTLVHELVHTEEVLRATEDGLLRSAEELADAQLKRLEAREGTAQDWVFARRAVLHARIDSVRARAAHIFARFRAQEALLLPSSTRSK